MRVPSLFIAILVFPSVNHFRYVINMKQFAKFVVALGDQVAPTDFEEGMRVGVVPHKYTINLPLPPKIDASVTLMQVPCSLFKISSSSALFRSRKSQM